jgi:hypothetical protein
MKAVLTADLIDSSQYDEGVLKKVLDTLTSEFDLIIDQNKKKKIRFNIYRGDSFQGIVENPENALLISLQIKAAINRIHLKKTRKNKTYSKVADFKIAIGIGTIDLERKAISESNGQAFQFSGRSLDEMKTGNRKTRLKTPNEEVDDEFNTSFYLLDTITDKWSTASAEVVYYLLKGYKEREIATELNITQSAVNQRKKASGWEAITILLERFHHVIIKHFKMENSLAILLQLLLAHIFTDFLLQPKSWIAHKRKFKARSYILIIHSLIAGILTLLFLQDLGLWYIALTISITHYLIDSWKLIKNRDDLKFFLLDQLFHLIVILLVWLYLIDGFPAVIPGIEEIINSPAILAIVAAYLLIIFPAGYLIGKATQRWQEEIELIDQNSSLKEAGRYIGIFERILVLTFILTQNFSAIGFLIAAKSILRFSDKSGSGARKQTEYVLIGTLMSFAITILLGLLVNTIILQ